MVGFTWFHAVLILAIGPALSARGAWTFPGVFLHGTTLHAVVGGLLVAGCAAVAGIRAIGRTGRATAVGIGLMTSSAVLVHLSGGYVELHFHFFVMVIFMALYQDWIPYLLAILYVAIHHGVVGVLWPEFVYNHPAAINAPWTWAGIHAFFVLWASVGSIISWRYTEQAFGQIRLLLESAGEGIFGLSQGGTIIFINSAAIQMLGLERASTLGQPMTRLVRHTKADGSAHPEHDGPILRPLTTGVVCDVTDELFWRGDGTAFSVDLRSSPIVEKGVVTGVVVTFNDVTERKKAQEAIRAGEVRYAGILDIAHEAIISIDEGQRIVVFNKGAEKIFGYSQTEILGASLERLLPARFLERHRVHVDEFARDGVGSRRMQERREVFGLRKDGSEFPAEASISTLELNGERICTVVLWDITSRQRADAERKTSLSLLSATVESTADGILVVNQSGNIIHYNQKFVAMWRIPEPVMTSGDDNEAIRCVLGQLRDPDAFIKKVKELYADPEAESQDILLFQDGRVFERYSQPQRIDGQSVGRVWSFRDITERVRAEEEIRLLHTMTRLISEADDLYAALHRVVRTVCEVTGWMGGQAWIPRTDGRLECSSAWHASVPGLYAVRSASETLTFGEGEGLPGQVWSAQAPLWLPEDLLRATIPIGAISQTAGIRAALGIPVLAGGRMVAVLEFYIREPRQEDQRLLRVVSDAARQVGELIQKKLTEAELEKQATHDALTELYNRRYFAERTLQELARAKRQGYPLAVVLADLDRFKAINDTLGHHTGDIVLQTVARRLREASRGTDLVFRWGGDEFVIVLSQISREALLIAADRIRAAVRAVANETSLDFDLSVGIAVYPEHGQTVDELVRVADRALYLAKKSGDQVKIGEEDYQLTDDAVKVVFQPIFAVCQDADGPSREVVGYEALSRDPAGKLSVAELFAKYRRIGKLDELKRLCFSAQLNRARELGLPRVFLNVEFGLLTQWNPPPAKPPHAEIILEISEMEALDNIETRLEVARVWRAHGYKFALDDFGAGYISLPFIARFMPEYIKIDRSAILHAVASPQFKEFMIGLVSALRNYSTEGIIGEGVETEHELQVTSEMGVRLVQGFLFGRPGDLTARPSPAAVPKNAA
jgi:diguanylate cyclase (GGDEF)-like protein/PAS domain S-box-containing protein